jgi:hypothetical protein
MTQFLRFLRWLSGARRRGVAAARGALWVLSVAMCLDFSAPRVLRAQTAPEPSTAVFAQRASAPAPSSVPPAPDPVSPADEDDDTPAMFPHPETDRVWLSGQMNFISQWHPAFYSPYQGPHSL